SPSREIDRSALPVPPRLYLGGRGGGGDDLGAGRGLDLLVLAQEGDDGHLGGVTLADLGELVDAGVAAGTALEAGADLVEELEGDVLAVQDRQRAAKLVQVEAVAGGADQLLDVGLKLLRLGQGRGDLAMLQKRGGQVAQ